MLVSHHRPPVTVASPRHPAPSLHLPGGLPFGLGAPRFDVRDGIAVAMLMAVGAVVRYVYLWDVPRFRDETFGALLALAIYRGEQLPLTDIEYYIGPLYNYLVAGVMLGFGPSYYIPRLVVMVCGVLTLGVTYLLGREVGGRWGGLVAAGLLVTNGVHVASISHRGFSADMAVFFATVAWWLLHRARARQSGQSLAWSGLFLGLALHTHPTTVAYFPGVVCWLLPCLRSWLRTRWPYLAVGLFLLAYAPMIAFNVETAGGSVRHALYTASERPDYTLGGSTALTVQSYAERQRDFWSMSFNIVGGTVDTTRRSPWQRALAVAPALWAVAGLAYAARRGYSLPLWLLGSCAIALPVFNARHWDVLGDAHYVAKVLSPVYATMGLVAVVAMRRLWGWRSAGGRVLTACLALGAAATILAPLVPLSRYYADALKAQPPNAGLIQVIDDLQARRQPDEVVVLDERLNDQRVQNAAPWDEASTFRVFRFIMAFDDVPCLLAPIDDRALTLLSARGRSTILILAPGSNARDTAELMRRIERFGLQDLDGRAARAARPVDRYGVYRLTPPVASDGAAADGDLHLPSSRDCGSLPALPSVTADAG